MSVEVFGMPGLEKDVLEARLRGMFPSHRFIRVKPVSHVANSRPGAMETPS